MAEVAANWSPFGDSGRDLPMTRAGTTVSIAETPATFVLQGNCSDDGLTTRLRRRKRWGSALPKGRRRGVHGPNTCRAFWLGPDMWLVLAPAGRGR